jgi:hypothetical protein
MEKTVNDLLKTPCDEVLETKDIYFAAALHSLGYHFDSVDKTDLAHQQFKFMGNKLSDLEVQWINGTLIGNLSQFADSIRRMKSLIHSSD